MEIELPPTSSRVLHFSTEMLPERERLSAFREEFVRRILAMDLIDHSGGRPRSDVTFMPLGGCRRHPRLPTGRVRSLQTSHEGRH